MKQDKNDEEEKDKLEWNEKKNQLQSHCKSVNENQINHNA